MIIYYRISDGSYPKLRFAKATKEACFKNFYQNVFRLWEDKLYIYADNVRQETWDALQEWILSWSDIPFRRDELKDVHIIRSNGGSSAGSFRLVFEEALKSTEDYVLFQEDDYWYLPDSDKYFREGLERADYVSLYDHPDKYIPSFKGGNRFVDSDGGEVTKVILTNKTHWKLTNSTTMTFATKVKILQEDAEIWRRHTDGTYPRDFNAFIELRNKGRSLITPIPGRATHCMPEWSGPLVNWEKEI